MQSLAFAGLFLIFLFWAALSDLAELRIPNRLTVAMAGTAPVAIWLVGPGAGQIPAALLTGLLVLAVCWTLFELGLMGGGDAKLACAVAIWLGPDATPLFVALTALCGALLAAGLLSMRRWMPEPSFVGARWRDRLKAESIPVPYAVAMAPAGLAAMFLLLSRPL